MNGVDHLVYATPDLELAIEMLEECTGVRATVGGRHLGIGTRNALIALGPGCYLEIIGPDTEQPQPELPRWFGIDHLDAPRLATWCASTVDLDWLAADAMHHSIGLGRVISGSRQRADGLMLSWRFTDPRKVVADGVVPFFIDWGITPHPSQTAATGVVLADLRAEHPDASGVRGMLERLDLDLPVQPGPRPALIATLDSPRGRVTLR